MKVLVINQDSVGEGLPLALRAAKAGHDVKIWFAKENNPKTGSGFDEITVVDNWLSHVKGSDLIVPTGNHTFMPKFDQLRKNGAKIFGPSVSSADLEIKRVEGMKLFEAAGIEIPEYQQFKTLDEAEAHVRKTGERFVFKVMGNEDDKSLSYVAKTPADLVARLQRWKKLGMQPKGQSMLQTVVEGVEVGVSRWMGTDGWVGPPNVNFEFKKLLSGNSGPNCGEAGTLMKYTSTDMKLFDEVLKPLEKALLKLGHLGDIDVNAIIDDKGKAWPLEFTCRLGWPAFNMQLASTLGDPIQWMLDACNGKDTLKTSTKVICGVVLAQPDYPFSKEADEKKTDIPIYGVTKANENYLFPQSVRRTKLPDMKGKEIIDTDMWATTGDYVMVVTGTGKTVRQACTRAYDTMDEIHLSDGMYRDDIGEKLEDEIPKLQQHGYCTDWSYE